MDVAVRRRIMSLEDFLAWEARQEMRYEFDGFEAVAMAGGTARHAAIQQRLSRALGNRLAGGPCDFYGSDFKLVTGSKARYPDGQVICGPVDPEAVFATTPVIVFEVVSPQTEKIDRDDKVLEYRSIASVRRYVILAQDRVAATVHARQAGGWTAAELSAGAVLDMPEIGVALPLAELFEGIVLPPG